MSEIIIKTDMLCKSFINDGQVNNVIKNMNLEIRKGDFTVIMGSSGSGKSTLLYTLSGMMDATGGRVYLDGAEITGLKEKEMARIRREKLGFVFQTMNLIPDLNVYENMISPCYKTGKSREVIEKRVKELAEELGMTEEFKKYPSQLSGGQKQRAAIIRAIMNEPAVLFADEPTGALGSAQGKKVLDIFSQIHEKGQSVVMVTHDLKAALRGNRILYIHDGRIDGDLLLEEYQQSDKIEREQRVYKFLKERGW